MRHSTAHYGEAGDLHAGTYESCRPCNPAPEVMSISFWTAGWNMPGYLPESEPVRFASWSHAHGYIHDTVQRFWDEDNGEAGDAIYLPVDTALNTAGLGHAWSANTGDDRLAFWIDEQVATLDAHDLEDIEAYWNEQVDDMAESFRLGRATADDLVVMGRWFQAREAVRSMLTALQNPNERHTATDEVRFATIRLGQYADLLVDAYIEVLNERDERAETES